MKLYKTALLMSLQFCYASADSLTPTLTNDMSIPYAVKGGTYATLPKFPCYRTVEGTFETAKDIVKNHPNLAQWIDAGDSWKKANDYDGGYDMNVLKITNLSKTQKKPALFITSSIHGDERPGAELATRFAEYLVENYGKDADITWMLDYHEVHLMLMANPDGHKLRTRRNAHNTLFSTSPYGYFILEDTLTRYVYKGVNKGTYPDGNSKGNRYGEGINLNRNFRFHWRNKKQNSNNIHLDYGLEAASEPETQAIQTYMKNLFGDHREPDLSAAAPLDTSGIFIDMHSAGNKVNWPWTHSFTTAPNATLASLGRKLAYFNDYQPAPLSYGQYIAQGTSIDYAYGELGIASYVFELGQSGHSPSCSIFNDTILPDNMPSLLYALKAVREPYVVPPGPEVLHTSLSTGTTPVSKGTKVVLTATADDTRYRDSNSTRTRGKHTYKYNRTEPSQDIIQAEYYVDTPPWEADANAIDMDAKDGDYDSKSETISSTIDTTSLSAGKHTIFVRAKDEDNHWGVVSAVFLTIESIPTISLNDTVNNIWDTNTVSTHRSDRYAKFYTFTLTQSTAVTIDLMSDIDTYLYLLQGNDKKGSVITEDDNGGNGLNSKITRTLPAGTYTIETTTYYSGSTGASTLRVSK